jgi:hypothetical protein
MIIPLSVSNKGRLAKLDSLCVGHTAQRFLQHRQCPTSSQYEKSWEQLCKHYLNGLRKSTELSMENEMEVIDCIGPRHTRPGVFMEGEFGGGSNKGADLGDPGLVGEPALIR